MPNNRKNRIITETRPSSQVHTLDTMQALRDTTLRKMVRTYTKTNVQGKNVMELWDFAVHIDRKIDASRLDIIIKNLKE